MYRCVPICPRGNLQALLWTPPPTHKAACVQTGSDPEMWRFMLGPAQGKAWGPRDPARLKADLCLQCLGSRVYLFSGVSCTSPVAWGFGRKLRLYFLFPGKEKKTHQANDSRFNSNCSMGLYVQPQAWAWASWATYQVNSLVNNSLAASLWHLPHPPSFENCFQTHQTLSFQCRYKPRASCVRLLIPSTRHTNSHREGTPCFTRGQKGSPLAPLSLSRVPGSKRSLRACEGISGLEPAASPGSDASDGPAEESLWRRADARAQSSHLCPGTAPLVFLRTALQGNSASCFLIAKQLEKNQRFLPLQQCASLGNTEKQRHSCQLSRKPDPLLCPGVMQIQTRLPKVQLPGSDRIRPPPRATGSLKVNISIIFAEVTAVWNTHV